MPIDFIFSVVFLIFLLLVIFYIRMSNKEIEDKLNGVYKAIDDSIKNIHAIKKEIVELKAQQESLKHSNFDDNLMQNCELLVNTILDERINEVHQDLGLIHQSLNEVAQQQDSRIATLELANEDVSKLRIDDDSERMQVFKLHKDGKSIEEIAMLLRKSPQAINIILKSI